MAAHEGCAAHSDEFFPFLPHHVPYDPTSTDPFVFRYYNKSEVIAGKTMGEWLRFSVAFWHTFRGDGSDPFGAPTKVRRTCAPAPRRWAAPTRPGRLRSRCAARPPAQSWPWASPTLSPMERAEAAMRANFELLVRLARAASPATAALTRQPRPAQDKLGVDYYCFHDRDIAPEVRCTRRHATIHGRCRARRVSTRLPRALATDACVDRAAQGATLAETNANLDKIVALAAELQGAPGPEHVVPQGLCVAPASPLTPFAAQLRTARSRCGARRRYSRTRGSCPARPRRRRLLCLLARRRR